MPVKTVSMSSRDPPWMTPLLESMIIRLTNSRVSCLSKDRLCLVNKRIADIISEKQEKVYGCLPGSRAWWKGVHELSQLRRASCKVNLDNSCLMDLNDYFARLCSDDMYIEPTPVTISSEMEITVVSVRQVWNMFTQRSQKNCDWTRPDSLRGLERACRDFHASYHQNLESLNLYSVFAIIVEARDYRLLPKIDVSKAHGDYRGINKTPVIARAFEKIVYHC